MVGNVVFHYLNNKLQTTYNPIADQYPKVDNPKIPGMTAFHANISIKGTTRRTRTTLISFWSISDDFFIGLQVVVVGQESHDKQVRYHLHLF